MAGYTRGNWMKWDLGLEEGLHKDFMWDIYITDNCFWCISYFSEPISQNLNQCVAYFICSTCTYQYFELPLLFLSKVIVGVWKKEKI